MNYECTFCFIRSFENLLKFHPIKEELKNKLVKDFISYISAVDLNELNPEIARDIHNMIRNIMNNPDPYKAQKKESNEYFLSFNDQMRCDWEVNWRKKR